MIPPISNREYLTKMIERVAEEIDLIDGLRVLEADLATRTKTELIGQLNNLVTRFLSEISKDETI